MNAIYYHFAAISNRCFMYFILKVIPSPMDSCKMFNVENGIFLPERMPVEIGVKGKYVCNSGFILNGTAERVCTILKEWSGQPAQCIPPPGEY